MLVTFRLSALGFGGTERVFLSVADFLSTSCGCQINFVVDKISGHETEQIALTKGYEVIGLNASRTWKTIVPFAKYLKMKKPDIVLSAYTETNAAALISNAINRFRAPIVVTEHASLDDNWRNRSSLQRVALELMVRYVYKFADHVLCVSRGVAEQLAERLTHAHISYIHNPARFTQRVRPQKEARLVLGIDPEISMILAVGRICKHKNYLMLLQAFKNLQTTDSPVLYIVGGVHEADEKARIDKFIAEHDLGGRVQFVDFTEDVQVYYEAADLLALSSTSEGFGNVLVEALAFGLPVVSSRCKFGPAEILEDGKFGVLVEVDDFAAMSKAIHQVLEQNPFDPQRQIQRAESFSERRIGEQYYQLICATSGRAA